MQPDGWESIFDGYEQESGYVGVASDVAMRQAQERGLEVRVIDVTVMGRDRLHMDRKHNRINLLVEQGLVRKAAKF